MITVSIIFHLRFVQKKNYINNHVSIKMLYNKTPKGNRIVGFEVTPFRYVVAWVAANCLFSSSKKYPVEEWKKFTGDKTQCPTPISVGDGEDEYQTVSPSKEGEDILWTYDVVWEEVR